MIMIIFLRYLSIIAILLIISLVIKSRHTKKTKNIKCEHDWCILESIDTDALYRKLIGKKYDGWNEWGVYRFFFDMENNTNKEYKEEIKEANKLKVIKKWIKHCAYSGSYSFPNNLENKICRKCETKKFQIYTFIEEYKKLLVMWEKISTERTIKEKQKEQKEEDFKVNATEILNYKKLDLKKIGLADSTIKTQKENLKNYALNKAIHENKKCIKKMDRIQERILKEENEKLKGRLKQLENLSGMYSIKPNLSL